jgi:xanthine/CO dehydrogenase XdhC/CoxF family maturation factor
MLRRLLASAARYIGVMGPRHRTDRMLQELASGADAELLADASLARLHAPVGLDIGASGPADIALSIVAEMRAVIDERRGGMLRERGGGIHERPGPEFSTAGGVRQCRTS